MNPREIEIDEFYRYYRDGFRVFRRAEIFQKMDANGAFLSQDVAIQFLSLSQHDLQLHLALFEVTVFRCSQLGFSSLVPSIILLDDGSVKVFDAEQEESLFCICANFFCELTERPGR
jgi:hypothetical protein